MNRSFSFFASLSDQHLYFTTADRSDVSIFALDFNNVNFDPMTSFLILYLFHSCLVAACLSAIFLHQISISIKILFFIGDKRKKNAKLVFFQKHKP